jgi:hypothetical protein
MQPAKHAHVPAAPGHTRHPNGHAPLAPQVLQSMTRQAAGKLGSSAAAGSAWRSLPPEQLAAKVGAADARRKALQQQMPAEQWALEQRWVLLRAGHHE